MRCERIGAGLAAAALGLFAAPPPAIGADLLLVPLCHGGFVTLPLSRDRDPGNGKSCPGGCHAACLGQRKQPRGTPGDRLADA